MTAPLPTAHTPDKLHQLAACLFACLPPLDQEMREHGEPAEREVGWWWETSVEP